MWWMLLSAFGIVTGLLYFLLIVSLVRQWHRMPEGSFPDDALPCEPVSVIVAAKNEEAALPHLLNCLLAQNLPPALFEVIVVNDGSTDKTTSAFEAMDLPAHFSIITNTGTPGKKSALTLGIKNAKFEHIVVTDADCCPGKNWLRCMALQLEAAHADFVAGPVEIGESKHLLEYFQALDFAGLMVVTGAGIFSRKFFMANGANMAFKKSTFESVGGYEGNSHIASGDDMFLINKMARAGGKIIFNKTRDAIVQTKAISSLAGLWRQRLRWAGKNAALEDFSIKAVLALILAVSVFSLGFFWMPAGIAVLLLKMSGDYLLLSAATRFFNNRHLIKWFLPSFLIHTVYVAIVGISGRVARAPKWKD